MKLFNRKMTSNILFVVAPVIILASCGGGGGGSDSSGTINAPDAPAPLDPDTPVKPVTPDAPDTSGLTSWPFINPGDYAYDSSKIRISGGVACLVLADRTDDDNGPTGFGGGAHGNTAWDADNSRLELAPGDGPFDAAGSFTSRVIDALESTSWSALSWTPQRSYHKELPDNAQSETAYAEGNADMTGNILLMHMNETSGGITDYSGNGNNGTVYDEMIYGVGGVFNAALYFESAYIELPALTPASASDITITAWFKTTSGGTISALGGASCPGLGVSEGYVAANNNQGNISATGASIVNDGNWHYVAAVIGGSGIRIYVDGNLDAPPGAAFDSSGNNYGRVGLGTGFHWGRFGNGTIDEVAVYNRGLSDTEILDRYKRGALRLQFQVRSCNGPSCDQEQFAGPDGTAATFYSELENSTTGLPSLALTNISDNRYFQYKAYLESDDSAYSPELKSVLLGPGHFSGDSPTIVNNIGQKYSLLHSFTEKLGGNNEGEIRYQISNNGTNWYYHNGTNWEAADGYPETNLAPEINMYLWDFHSQIGTGTFYFKAFLHSDTNQQVELDRVYLSYSN